MRPRESYTPFISVAFGLTLTILIVFQIYNFREPTRILADLAADLEAAISAGHDLYEENCGACHGEGGEGGVGPALNSRQLLSMTADEALFNLTITGVPGTIMPAWGQAFGGPLTDQQATELVAFIRAWEPTAPEIATALEVPDPVRGVAIYNRTCSVCHGENGQGIDPVPALNDPGRLGRLDDAWYRNTIAHGRPAKGMPTWGTVLSPAQIDDVVALFSAWREGETVIEDVPLAVHIGNALFAIQEFDRDDAEFYLNAALAQADPAEAQELREIIELVRQNQLFVAQGRVATLLPPEAMGLALFTGNCVSCHGSDGTGGLGPNLHGNGFIQSNSDEELIAFVLAGRGGMDGFQGILSEEELQNVMILLRTWQE